MGLSYNVYVGCYLVCERPVYMGAEGDMLEEFRERFGESLTEAENNYGPIEDGVLLLVPNTDAPSIGILIDPIYDESMRAQLPDDHTATAHFVKRYGAEVEWLRQQFGSVRTEYGVLSWAL